MVWENGAEPRMSPSVKQAAGPGSSLAGAVCPLCAALSLCAWRPLSEAPRGLLGAGPSGSLGSRQAGLSGWRMRAQYLQRAGLVALWNVRYSQNSDQVPVPCLGTRTPNHWAPEEGPACRSGDCGFVAQSEVKDPDLLQLFSSPKVALSLQALCVLDRF